MSHPCCCICRGSPVLSSSPWVSADVLLGLLDLLKGARREKTMVFCNTHRSTEWLSSVLTERRIVHMKLHSYQSAAVCGCMASNCTNVLFGN
jgi:hypothetical protein